MKRPDLTIDNIAPKYWSYVVNPNAPFWQAMAYADEEVQPTGVMNSGIYNLLLTRRDLSIYVKADMRPHRNWKLKDVRQYFGIKGSATELLDFMNMVVADLQILKN